MHIQRNNYWSLSKVSNFIRNKYGIPTPYALSSEEWKSHEEKYSKHFVYKFTEFFDCVQNFIYYPYDIYFNIKCYIKNRFFYRTHLINTKLKKGKWHEYDERMLYGNFELLVDYIENDKTLKTLEWEINDCRYESQKNAAIIQKELYDWWKIERNSRIKIYEEENEELLKNEIKKLSKYKENFIENELIKHYDLLLEELYYLEDDFMLNKLINIRHYLWI